MVCAWRKSGADFCSAKLTHGDTGLLHAIAQKKSSLARKRYHVLSRRQVGDRRTQEDEITSIVFGAMDFMAPAEVLSIWRTLLDMEGLSTPHLPNDAPESVQVRFWPRQPIGIEGIASVEPDLRIDFTWKSGARWTALVEVKWHAPLGSRQLQKQWLHTLTAAERSQSHHIFIGNHVGDVLSARDEENVWGTTDNRLLPLTWRGLRSALDKITEQPDSYPQNVVRYAQLVGDFLMNSGITTFRGFAHIPSGSDDLADFQRPVFWTVFQGFQKVMSALPPRTQPLTPPLFFSA